MRASELEAPPTAAERWIAVLKHLALVVLTLGFLSMLAWISYTFVSHSPVTPPALRDNTEGERFTPIVVRTRQRSASPPLVSQRPIVGVAATTPDEQATAEGAATAARMLPIRLAMAQSLLTLRDTEAARPLLRLAAHDTDHARIASQRRITSLCQIASWQITAEDTEAAAESLARVVDRLETEGASWSSAQRDTGWLSVSTIQWRLGMWREAEESLARLESDSLRAHPARQMIAGYEQIDAPDEAQRNAARWGIARTGATTPNTAGGSIEAAIPTLRIALTTPALRDKAEAKIAARLQALRFSGDLEAARDSVALVELLSAIQGRLTLTGGLEVSRLVETTVATVRRLPAGKVRSDFLSRLALATASPTRSASSGRADGATLEATESLPAALPLTLSFPLDLAAESLASLDHFESGEGVELLVAAVAVAARERHTAMVQKWLERLRSLVRPLPAAEQAGVWTRVAGSLAPLGDVEQVRGLLNEAVQSATRVWGGGSGGAGGQPLTAISDRRLRDSTLEATAREQLRLALISEALATTSVISEAVLRDRLYQLTVYERLAVGDLETATEVALKLSAPLHRLEVMRNVELVRHREQ